MRSYFPHAGLFRLCGLFGKTRQAFYDAQHREADQFLEQGLILDQVREIRKVMPRIGTIKLHHMLRPALSLHSIAIGRDRFRELLRDNDLLVKARKRRYATTTNSNHDLYKWPNLVEGFIPLKPHQLWVSDITYLRTRSGFVYLSLITDAWSRKIIGHHLSHSLSAKGCILALQKAIGQLPEGARVIHHSDRGLQYCCKAYVKILLDRKAAISMTQTGSPYDNAQAERVNGILKTELGLDATFDGYKDALQQVSKSIDIYNRSRPHMSCRLLTPEAAHQQHSFSEQPINPKDHSKQPLPIFAEGWGVKSKQ